MTVLQIINRVLRRLREDQVTDTTDEYTKLIESFLSDIHAEVVAAHDWSSMDATVSTSAVAGQNEYSLAGTNELTCLRYTEGKPLVYWYDDVSDTDGECLIELSWEKYLDLLRTGTEDTDKPGFFAFRVVEDEAQVALWPAPLTSDGYFTARVHIPETQYQVGDSTSQTLKAPSRVLVNGVLYLALNERGEEMGEPGHIAERRYLSSMTDAIDADIQRSGRTNRLEFYRD